MKIPNLPKFQFQSDERLIRGRSVLCPWRLYKMKQQGITQIIDLRHSSFLESPLEKYFCNLLGIKYDNFSYPARLNTVPDRDFFEKINITILNNSTGKTYIHCKHGHTRTGVAVAIYEHLHTNKSIDEILDELFNFGFKELRGHFIRQSKLHKKQSIIYDMINKYFE